MIFKIFPNDWDYLPIRKFTGAIQIRQHIKGKYTKRKQENVLLKILERWCWPFLLLWGKLKNGWAILHEEARKSPAITLYQGEVVCLYSRGGAWDESSRYQARILFVQRHGNLHEKMGTFHLISPQNVKIFKLNLGICGGNLRRNDSCFVKIITFHFIVFIIIKTARSNIKRLLIRSIIFLIL